MIRNYVRDVDVFLRSYREDFLGLRNCGLKTANELIRFQRELRKKLGYGTEKNDSEDEISETHKKAVIGFLSRDKFFNQIFDSQLSHPFFKPLRRRGIDTLEKILVLRYEDALRVNHGANGTGANGTYVRL